MLLDFGEFEEIKPANNPQEMRAEFYRLTQYNPIVKSIFDMANYQGLSGEDKYTILAYNTLKLAVELQKWHLKIMQTMPKPIIIHPEDLHK